MKKTVVMMGVTALALGLAACTDSDLYSDARSDATISAEVKRELSEEQLSSSVTVTALDGAVTLTGTVPDTGAKDRAEDIAEDVNGVKSVKNDLRIMAGDAPAHPYDAPRRALPPDDEPQHNPDM
jgi:hypothetical protein